MGLSDIKKLLLSSAIFLTVLHPANSLSAGPDELKQKLEQLQRSLQGSTTEEPVEELEKKLKMLKEGLKEEGVIEGERIPSQEKSPAGIEKAAAISEENRFFIEGKYWLAYTDSGDKEVASFYNVNTKQAIGSIDASPSAAGAFIISGGYRHDDGDVTSIRLWRSNTGDSNHQTSTSTTGISGTEGSDYYYQNVNQWGTSAFSVRGVDEVDADLNLEGLNLDVIHSIAIGKGANKELGVELGLKYAQVDSNYQIIYSSSISQLYSIESNVENTLLGPIFGIYGKGPIFKKLSFKGMFNVALAWDHVRAARSEYDYTVPQAAVTDATRASDIVIAVMEGEMGIRYAWEKNLLLALDYKAAYFSGLPFELRPAESTLADTVELLERDVLFHGLTAGVSYLF